MSDEVDAELAVSCRREAALAGALHAVGHGGVESTPLRDVELNGLSRPVPIHEVSALR